MSFNKVVFFNCRVFAMFSVVIFGNGGVSRNFENFNDSEVSGCCYFSNVCYFFEVITEYYLSKVGYLAVTFYLDRIPYLQFRYGKSGKACAYATRRADLGSTAR